MEKLLRATLPDGRFSNVPKVRSLAMAAVKGKHNRTTEIQFRMALVRAGITGWLTHSDLPGKPDVYFSKAKIAIFLDGCFWHGCGRCGHIPKTNNLFWATKIRRTQARDRKTSRLLRKRGVHVIRTWEHTLSNPTQLKKILERIQGIIRETPK
ncbi:MAG TPA: very short patch repair endonuclease [Pyrinomonadaceae bacterium]|jgi:DNA mismatch endonuclease (patch repair protein)|nr:very short patch repair endonuclease [Pyrinomonadaceae bacterium]